MPSHPPDIIQMEVFKMKADRIFNFNAGPAALPLPVLEEIQESFLDFAGSGAGEAFT